MSGIKITRLTPDGYGGRRNGSFAGKTAGATPIQSAPAAVNLPPAPDAYSRDNEQRTRNVLRTADAENFKRGRDVRLQQGERFILKSANGTLYQVTVTDGGVLTVTAI